MTPDFLGINRGWAGFYFDKIFKIVIIPIKDYKNYNIYANEYEKGNWGTCTCKKSMVVVQVF
jgi:hypothetical protein